MQLRLLVLTVGLLTACADRTGSIFIAADITGDEDCAFSPGNAQYARGVMDISMTYSYLAHPLYYNQLVSRGSTAPLMADPNGFHILGAVVDLRDTNGAAIAGIPSFTIVESTFIPSSRMSSIGQAVGSLELIPPAFGQVLDGAVPGFGGGSLTVVAVVQPFGETSGGTEVEVDPWQWPIDVCRGCLVTFPGEADGPLAGICDSTEAPMATPCVRGNDEYVDCRLCVNDPNTQLATFCRTSVAP